MRKAVPYLITMALCAVMTGCASNAIMYIPAQPQLVASEFYETSLAMQPAQVSDKVVKAMQQFDWLHRQDGGLVYVGNVPDANPYVNCGMISYHYPIAGETGQIPFASPNIKVMDFDNRAAINSTTNLDVTVDIAVIPENAGSRVRIKTQYSLNRKLARGGWTKSYPPERNTPIQFTTTQSTTSADGITCSSRLTLEQKIIEAINL